jgi:hypothetical protein
MAVLESSLEELNVIQRRMTCLAVLALIAGARPTLAETWREQSEKTFDAVDLAAVRVENARGVVVVTRGDPGRIRLTALKTVRASDLVQKRRYARGTTVVSEVEGDRLVIRVRYPQRQSVRLSFWECFNGYEMPRVEVRLTLEIPDGLAVQLQSTSGDLVSEDVAGRQALETTSGDVTVRGSRAPIRAHTTSGDISATGLAQADLETVSGDIEAESVRGTLRASTQSGDASVKGIGDSVKVTSVSGDIRIGNAPKGLVARSTSGSIAVEEARGTVSLETSSGDIRVALAPPLTRADISTVSGDVVAGLVGPIGMSLEMRTTNGTLDVDLPLEVRSVTRRLVSGVMGNGKTPVILRSSSGDIHLSSGGNP